MSFDLKSRIPQRQDGGLGSNVDSVDIFLIFGKPVIASD
jgi:hypothetical protein